MRDYVQLDYFILSELSTTDYQTDTLEKIRTVEDLNVPLKRAPKHSKTNTHGFSPFKCKNKDLFILNGRYGNDKNIGKFAYLCFIISGLFQAVECL